MGKSRVKVEELEGGEKYHGFDHFGVTVIGVNEDAFKPGASANILPTENCSLFRFRCNSCGTVFDVEPKSKDPNTQKIPLCPAECNIDLLEKWVDEQERKGKGA